MTQHVDVGAYLLGALDDADMTRFEKHLTGCEECGRELDELSGLLPILAEVREDSPDGNPFAGPPSGDGLLSRLLAEVSAERRGRRHRRLAAVAAAAVLVVGGPAVAVLATADGGGSPAAVPGFAHDRVSASNPATGASAIVGVADKAWGTAVDLRLSGVRGPLTCSLIAVAKDGHRQTVATWSVPKTGYGTTAQPAPLTVHGASGWHRTDIQRFDVTTAGGTLLVSVRA